MAKIIMNQQVRHKNEDKTARYKLYSQLLNTGEIGS
jgi:hypothetical protein